MRSWRKTRSDARADGAQNHAQTFLGPRIAGLPLPQLRRVRWGVRGVLALGVAASVTANILHALPNPVSQVIAAWPPLALLLTIELISRVPVHSQALAVVRFCATTAIAGIAAWVSYWHMAGVAARYGETGASPFMLPLSVDGLVIVASVCLVELAGQIRIRESTQAEPIKAPARVAPMTTLTWHGGPDGRALLPIVSRTARRKPEPQPIAPKSTEAADKPAAGPTPDAPAWTVPADARAVAVKLAAAGKTGGDIWRAWGEPETPKRRTIEWWIAEARKAPSVNGGRPHGA